MNPEITFYTNLIEMYQSMVELCKSEAEKSNDPFWWESQRITMESRINEAENQIGIIELKEEIKTIHLKLSA